MRVLGGHCCEQGERMGLWNPVTLTDMLDTPEKGSLNDYKSSQIKKC